MGMVSEIMHHSGFFGVCLSRSRVDKTVCIYIVTISQLLLRIVNSSLFVEKI